LALRQASGEYVGFLAGDGCGGFVHLLGVVHDAVGAVLGEDHQVHTGQALLHADHHVGDLACIGQYFGLGVQARHLVVDNGNADGVVAAGNIAVDHVFAPSE